MNFTRWSARLPGTQRRAAAQDRPRGSSPRQPRARAPSPRPAPSTSSSRRAPPAVPAVDDLSVREILGQLPALVAARPRPRAPRRLRQRRLRRGLRPPPTGDPAREALPRTRRAGPAPAHGPGAAQRQAPHGQVPQGPAAADTRRTRALLTVTCTPVEATRTSDGGVLVFAADVTDHAEAAERLRASERRQRETAVTLQRCLLPQELEQPDDLRVAATYQPGGTDAAVGGDWYDVITLGAGRTALVIGDVMGRGVRAAAVMGQLRTAVRAYARLDLPPHEVLQLLDGLAAEIDASQIATCVYAVHDPNEGRLVYASAGHLPILVRDEDGTVRRAEEPDRPAARHRRLAAHLGHHRRSAPAPPPSSTRTAWSSAAARTSTRASPPWSAPSPAPPAPRRSSATV